MRRYRQRRRDGLRCVTVQLRETEIEATQTNAHNKPAALLVLVNATIAAVYPF